MKVPIKALAQHFVMWAKANSTPIATGAVIIGMVSAVILAVKAGRESAEDIEEAKEEMGVEELTPKEIIKVVWKRFIPVVIILGLTIGCLVVNTTRMVKRYAALSTAYALSESYLKDYMDATLETVGDKKEQAIRDTAMEKQVEKHPFETEGAVRGIIETGHGDTLFYDSITTRYFHDSMEHVKSVERDLQGIYETEEELYLDDYTKALLGINTNFENIGWKRSGKFDGSQSIMFDYTTGMTKNGTPYIAIYHYRNRLTVL